jgi:hypothetical protein
VAIEQTDKVQLLGAGQLRNDATHNAVAGLQVYVEQASFLGVHCVAWMSKDWQYVPLVVTAMLQAATLTTPAVAQLLMQETGEHKLEVAGHVVGVQLAQAALIIGRLRHKPPGTVLSQESVVQAFPSSHKVGLVLMTEKQPRVLSQLVCKQMLVFTQGVVVATSHWEVFALQVYELHASGGHEFLGSE